MKPVIKINPGLAIAMVASFLLSACGGGGLSLGGFGGSSSTPGAETFKAPDGIRNALCNGNPAAAYEALMATASIAPTDLLYMAYAQEMAGLGARARRSYARVARTGSRDNVSLRCGRQTLLSGNVSDVAGNRLALVTAKLMQLDANLSPTARLHAGLGPSPEPKVEKPVKKAPALKLRTTKLRAPASAARRGQWFAHIASYTNKESADRYLETYKKKYAVLEPSLLLWSLNISGNRAWRLGVRTREWSDADTLCVAMRSRDEYCRVLDTSK